MNRLNKIFLLLLVFLISLCLLQYRTLRLRDDFSCTVISAGQGDCTLIRYKHTAILIDGGEEKDKYQKKILRLLRHNDVHRIQLLVVSHAHADHLFGILEIIRKIPADAILMPEFEHSTELYKTFRETIDKSPIRVLKAVKGLTLDFSAPLSLKVLSPPTPSPFKDIDNNSCVIKINYGKTSFLFTGDIFFEAEQWLCENVKKELKSDFLKVAHHGSKTSSSQAFLKMVNPEIAVISCGINNKFRFPHETALKRLEKWCSHLYRTDLQGNIEIIVKNQRMLIKTEYS